MTGFSRKVLHLSHDQDAAMRVRVEVDVTGTGLWVRYAMLNVPPGRVLEHRFPDGFGACWVRFVPLTDARATAQLIYGGASR
jgi:hypothetical protein